MVLASGGLHGQAMLTDGQRCDGGVKASSSRRIRGNQLTTRDQAKPSKKRPLGHALRAPVTRLATMPAKDRRKA
jgi:hypothetical protein